MCIYIYIYIHIIHGRAIGLHDGVERVLLFSINIRSTTLSFSTKIIIDDSSSSNNKTSNTTNNKSLLMGAP